MANSLGSLVVRLGLDAAEFTSGLTKSEYQAQKFARSLDKSIAQAATLAAGAVAAIAAGAATAFYAMDRLVKQAGDFQDLAEKTGDSAAALASLSVAAQVGGTDMATASGFAIKLSKNLAGVDDESKAAGAALKAMGIDIERFKSLNAADKLETLAKALGEFDDGPGKGAALESLAKGGAQLLPFLNELANGTGRLNILTAEQIKQADEYADKQARSRAELNLYAQALATQMVPALTAVQDAASKLIREFLGVNNGAQALSANSTILDWAESASLGLGMVLEAATGVAKGVRALAGSFESVWADLKVGAQNATPAMLAKNLATGDLFKQLAERNRIAKEANERYVELWNYDGTKITTAIRKSFADQRSLLDGAQRRIEDRGFIPGSGEKLEFDGKDDKAKAERETEAERYLEKLQRQLDATRELSVEETVLAEIATGRLKISGKVTQEQLIGAAALVDASKEQAAWEKLRLDAQAAELKNASKLREEDEKRLKTFMDQTPSAMLQKQRDDVEYLTKALEAGRISEEQYLEAVTARLDLVAPKLEKQKTLAEELGLTFTSAFEDAIVEGKKFSDVLKGLEKDILRIIVRKQITEPIGNWVNGSMSGISGILSGLFGGGGGGFTAMSSGGLPTSGGRAIGGPVEAGGLYRVNENGPEMLDVNGKQFLMMGGERGRVIPNGSGGGTTIVNNWTVGDVASVSMVQRAIRMSESKMAGGLARSRQYGGAMA